MTTTLDVNPAVADFASAVRRSLFDLGAETVDELTDGLEADLADKLADGAELGDPAAYAAELRAAAGLEAPHRTTVSENVRSNIASLRARLVPFAANPVVAFAVSLRPVWWLARGVVLFAIVNWHHPGSVVPNDPFLMLVLAGIVVMSIQWGRGRWLPRTWSRPAVIVLSAIAVLMIPQVAYVTDLQRQNWANSDFQPTEGIFMNGEQVTNIFAYGPDGEPVVDVRLFDQNGNPLAVIPEGWEQKYAESNVYGREYDPELKLVPSTGVVGSTGWNVYPLETVRWASIDESGSVSGSANRSPATPPFATVQQLLGYEEPLEEAPEE